MNFFEHAITNWRSTLQSMLTVGLVVSAYLGASGQVSPTTSMIAGDVHAVLMAFVSTSQTDSKNVKPQ